MRIDAENINDWAKNIEARSEVPRLIRKLMHASGRVTFCNVPAGNAVNQSGWDGELIAEKGNAWVPEGRSFWEISCEAKITSKATLDYEKRTKSTPESLRKKSTFVFITARKWSDSGKQKWLKEKQNLRQWADIRFYDAINLEQWLEQNPAVALEFSDNLGITGYGVEGITRYWDTWSGQTSPAVSTSAILAEHDYAKNELISEIQKRLDNNSNQAYSIQADSVEEAVAFICASLSEHPEMEACATIVTQADGWRFIEQNPSVKIVIASRPEVANNIKQEEGQALIIPFAMGDLEGHFSSVANPKEGGEHLRLERPTHQTFEKSLISLGIEESDATRLANLTGRSWSVFRRQKATNPAIRSPEWLNHSDVSTLAILCILGGWIANNVSDQKVIAEISGESYETIEKKLLALAAVDDSPIIKIGHAWKAKSPLELLNLAGQYITQGELDRFFVVAKRILSQPDPQLELPDEERYAAQIHGKVRPNSGLLIRSICDSLVKLSVRGTQIICLQHLNLEDRTALLVRNLLNNADKTRWLSLSSYLSPLAEASPGEFLKAVEQSLAKAEQPVTQLLKETSSSGLFGRCWHADLLWALELLAWAPERLLRISLILANLAKVKIKGNWANSPLSTLTDLYRTWLPQTAANIDQRITALDQLITNEPEIAFELIEQLVKNGSDVGNHSSRPTWREDDAGAGRGVTGQERHQMLLAAADKQIEMTVGNYKRVSNLLSKIDIYDNPRRKKIISMARSFANPPKNDEACEILRKPLRERIHWHRNYSKETQKQLDKYLKPIEALYADLEPDGLILRYKWLFADGWPRLPMRSREEDYKERDRKVEQMRIKALQAIYDTMGLSGVGVLADVSQGHIVGFTISKLVIGTQELIDWIITAESEAPKWLDNVMRGLLRALPRDRRNCLLKSLLDHARQSNWDNDRISHFFSLAPVDNEVWTLVSEQGAEIDNIYWGICDPGYVFDADESELEFVLSKLLSVKRPRTAFHFCHLEFKKVRSNTLAEILEQILQGHENQCGQLESWYIQEAIERLEVSDLDKQRLMRIEFGLIPALGYNNEGAAKTLYSSLLSDPKLFIELLCVLYRQENREKGTEEPIDENQQATATIAWRVLHHCKQLPGQKADGSIDEGIFVSFIDAVRKMAKDADRLAVCEVTLGEILAHAPSDFDGTWPLKVVRDILDRPELEDMRRGFHTGVLNKRGVICKSPSEGGEQERSLAAKYDKYAQKLLNSHPLLSVTLTDIADSYRRDASNQDLDARLRQEIE